MCRITLKAEEGNVISEVNKMYIMFDAKNKRPHSLRNVNFSKKKKGLHRLSIKLFSKFNITVAKIVVFSIHVVINDYYYNYFCNSIKRYANSFINSPELGTRTSISW